MTRERRSANRVTVAIHPSRVDLLDGRGPVEAPMRAVQITDLAHGGARLRVVGTLAVDDHLALDFSYRGRAFTIPGRVVWSEPSPDDHDGEAIEVGVQFEDIPPLTRARLESVLGRHLELNGSDDGGPPLPEDLVAPRPRRNRRATAP